MSCNSDRWPNEFHETWSACCCSLGGGCIGNVLGMNICCCLTSSNHSRWETFEFLIGIVCPSLPASSRTPNFGYNVLAGCLETRHFPSNQGDERRRHVQPVPVEATGCCSNRKIRLHINNVSIVERMLLLLVTCPPIILIIIWYHVIGVLVRSGCVLIEFYLKESMLIEFPSYDRYTTIHSGVINLLN